MRVLILFVGVVLLLGCEGKSVSSLNVISTIQAQGTDAPLSDVDSTIAFASIDTVAVHKPEKPTIAEIYTSQEGLEELTGNNDGPHIVMYHTAAGIDCSSGCQHPYCASGVRWAFDSAGVETTINAWSPTAHNDDNVVYESGAFIKEPLPGDVITLYYRKLGRIGHTGFVDKRINDRVVKTFEFNTNSLGSRDGGGNYFKYRPVKTLHSITRWTDE